MIESENKLIFRLNSLKITRGEVKKSFEEEFKVKVDKVNTLIDRKGKKKAVIKINSEFPAGDIGVKLGIIQAVFETLRNMAEKMNLQKQLYLGDKITEYWDNFGGKNLKEGLELIKMGFWGQSSAYQEGKL